jgi:hypothetical protein
VKSFFNISMGKNNRIHEEVFHLGWATVTQYAWNPHGPTTEQTKADFMDVFYGHDSPDMMPVYRLLTEGAQFFTTGWDHVTSVERHPGYGNSYGKGIGTRRTDEILGLPEIPREANLKAAPTFGVKYADLIKRAEDMKIKNDDLVNRLTRFAAQVRRNRYNLEVYLSIAYLERYFISTILTLRDAEGNITRAGSAVAEGKPANAVAQMVEACIKVGALISWSDWMWQNVTLTWDKSRHEKGRSVGGRSFVHVLDDVKDHPADRRKGLDYLIAPFQRMDLPSWRKELNERIASYAEQNKVPVRGLEEQRLED